MHTIYTNAHTSCTHAYTCRLTQRHTCACTYITQTMYSYAYISHITHLSWCVPGSGKGASTHPWPTTRGSFWAAPSLVSSHHGNITPPWLLPRTQYPKTLSFAFWTQNLTLKVLRNDSLLAHRLCCPPDCQVVTFVLHQLHP